jgi:hypothetical protein
MRRSLLLASLLLLLLLVVMMMMMTSSDIDMITRSPITTMVMMILTVASFIYGL